MPRRGRDERFGALGGRAVGRRGPASHDEATVFWRSLARGQWLQYGRETSPDIGRFEKNGAADSSSFSAIGRPLSGPGKVKQWFGMKRRP